MGLVYFIVVIIVRGLIIYWCVYEAKKKGRDTTTAGILGLIFGLWAALGYAFVKSKVNPLCPKCKQITMLKTVVKGKDTGKKFYVCANYPQCVWRIKA
jgi:ssDNA-binding Zn-finger/Zn-ribbon topoisomerase 1